MLTNQGAQLVSFQLLEHENSDGGPVDLVRARTSSPYPFGVVDSAGNSSPLNEALFESDQTVSVAGSRWSHTATEVQRERPKSNSFFAQTAC